MPGPVPVHAPMSGYMARAALNLCPVYRSWRDGWPKGTAQRSMHHARLKARQLEIAIHRIGRDIQQMRERGWLEPEEGHRYHPLEVEAVNRMLGLRQRMLKAHDHADRISRKLKSDASALRAQEG